MIIINPSKRAVEVDSEAEVKSLLKQKGFRLATDSETQAFFASRPIVTPEGVKSIYFETSAPNSDGYGQSQLALVDSLRKQDIWLVRKYAGQKVGIVYTYPYSLKKLKTDIKIAYTMFESTLIPPDWIEPLQLADLVIAPSKFCQDAFQRRGIKSKVVPLGYNPTAFYLDNKVPKRPKFTFLHFDAFNHRKGWDLVFKAFTEEFRDDEPVELILKTVKEQLPFPILRSQYPNIEIIKGSKSRDELRDLINSCHCFVFPSRGEGFGLTPLEALACGLPGIIPDGSGMSEYFNVKYFLPVGFDSRQAVYQRADFTPDKTGEMIEPRVADIRKQMRYAYENQAAISKMGAEGAEWVKKYTIDNTAIKLARLINPLNK